MAGRETDRQTDTQARGARSRAQRWHPAAGREYFEQTGTPAPEWSAIAGKAMAAEPFCANGSGQTRSIRPWRWPSAIAMPSKIDGRTVISPFTDSFIA